MCGSCAGSDPRFHAAFGGSICLLGRIGRIAFGLAARCDLLDVFEPEQHLIFGQRLRGQLPKRSSALTFALVETGLPGWACRIRTSESVRELLNWICVTISPEVGASPAAETLRVRAA